MHPLFLSSQPGLLIGITWEALKNTDACVTTPGLLTQLIWEMAWVLRFSKSASGALNVQPRLTITAQDEFTLYRYILTYIQFKIPIRSINIY